MPDSIDALVKSRAYFVRRAQQNDHARLFLLNYTAFVDDLAEPSTPTDQLEPRRADETDETYESRILATLLLIDAQQLAGSWKHLCAEELTYVRPSDAGWIAHLIMLRGMAWAQKAGYQAEPEPLTVGARQLIGALCPHQHWMAALDVLDNLVAIVNDPRSLIEVTEAKAQQHPVATIHASAAISAWLYSQAECVPNRAETTLELIGTEGAGGASG